MEGNRCKPKGESMSIICPFCGAVSASDEYCTKCHVIFNNTIRSIAYTEDNDPRSDRIGPLSTKAAKRLLAVFMVALVVAFVVLTELSGDGLLQLGRH